LPFARVLFALALDPNALWTWLFGRQFRDESEINLFAYLLVAGCIATSTGIYALCVVRD